MGWGVVRSGQEVWGGQVGYDRGTGTQSGRRYGVGSSQEWGNVTVVPGGMGWGIVRSGITEALVHSQAGGMGWGVANRCI